MKKKIIYFVLSILTLVIVFAIYFFSIKYFDRKIQDSTEVLASVKHNRIPNFIMPTQFVDGERFYFKLPISDKDSLMAFGDTGGGVLMLLPKAVNKKNIKAQLRTGILKGLMPIQYILYEDMLKDVNFPVPNPNSKLIIRRPFKRIEKPLLIIPPMEKELKLMLEVQPEMDAFLGQQFFMDHAWTIDYPNRQIMVNTPLHDSLLNNPNVQKLGFRKNANQEKLNGHPRMTVEIDGDTIDVLFDTGATLVLSEEGKKLLSTEKKTLGGSFIAISLFNKWRSRHPDWKYYPKADLAGDVIEVPLVKVSGYEVGPVLFAARRDEVWSKGMIQSMDKVVKGAIGGTVLKYFKVTIDYNSDLIRFEK